MAPPKDDTKYQVLETKLDSVREDIKEIREVLHGSYVSRAEFEPVRSVVYALIGLVLVSVVGALLTLVLRS